MLIDRIHRHRNIFYASDDSKSDYYISIILAFLELMYCNRGAIGANLLYRNIQATDSIGGALLLWAAGFLISWAGLMVYIEFGLSIPRYRGTDGHGKRPVPRSGGEKNYVSAVEIAPGAISNNSFSWNMFTGPQSF